MVFVMFLYLSCFKVFGAPVLIVFLNVKVYYNDLVTLIMQRESNGSLVQKNEPDRKKKNL